MADKQMLIDGVDVSECECFYINNSHHERKECINPYCKGLCEDNPNCYYKQLARAKNQIADLSKMVEAREQECCQLKAENEKLKKQHQGDKGLITSTGKMNYQLIREYDKLKNCLTEIKEIANYSFNRSTSEYMAKLERIDEKINEVLNE